MSMRNPHSLENLDEIFSLDDPIDAKHEPIRTELESKVLDEKKHHVVTKVKPIEQKPETADLLRLETYLEVQDYEGLEQYLLASRDSFAALAYGDKSSWARLVKIVHVFQDRISNIDHAYSCPSHPVAERIHKTILDPLMTDVQNNLNQEEANTTVEELITKSLLANGFSLLGNLGLGSRIAAKLVEYSQEDPAMIKPFLNTMLKKIKSDSRIPGLMISSSDINHLGKIHSTFFDAREKNKEFEQFCILLDEIIFGLQNRKQSTLSKAASSVLDQYISEEAQLELALQESLKTVADNQPPSVIGRTEQVTQTAEATEEDESELLAQAIALSLR